VTLTGYTVEGIVSMAKDPVGGGVLAVLKVMGAPRRLASLDLETAVATDIGSLGDNFSSIAFTPTGSVLYGVTGDGAMTPETLFSIDRATAVPTMVQTLGNGDDGEVIAFAGDATLFHWSGSEGLVETINIGVDTTSVLASSNSGEIFSAVWWDWHTDDLGAPEPLFLVGTLSSELRTMTTAGVYSADLAETDDDPRGLLFAHAQGYPVDATHCP
jgi:hypothetical protein